MEKKNIITKYMRLEFFFFHIIRYQNAKRLEKLFIWGNETTESETCLLNIFEHDGTKALKNKEISLYGNKNISKSLSFECFSASYVLKR